MRLTGGLNNGWDDPATASNGGPNYEGELTLNNKDKSVSLALNGIWGPNLVDPTGLGKSNSNLGAIDPIATWKPVVHPQPDASDRISVCERRTVR